MPARPATVPLMAQLRSAMFSGESPVTNAPISDSADARVARPKRGEAVDGAEEEGHAHDGDGKPEAIGRDPDAADRVGALRVDRGDQHLLGPHLEIDQRGEQAHDAERRHRLGHGTLVTQRTEYRDVEEDTRAAAWMPG